MNIPKYVESFRKDLLLKNYATSSIDNYCSQIATFLHDHDSTSSEPCKINEAMIKQWLLQSPSINGRRHRLSALKLFYKHTIKQPMKLRHIQYPRQEKKLPQPLDASEIKAMIGGCDNLKHKAIIYLLYGCGLRVSEVINLKPEHIDSKRMVINIIRAKGMKDRIVALHSSLLEVLRNYYKEYRPKEYLFNGQFSNQYSERSINQFLKTYAHKAGINRNIHAHLLRHSFATHSLEQGVDISIIQKLLGHQSPKTTQIYAHVSKSLISNVASPLSLIHAS